MERCGTIRYTTLRQQKCSATCLTSASPEAPEGYGYSSDITVSSTDTLVKGFRQLHTPQNPPHRAGWTDYMDELNIARYASPLALG